MTDLKIGGFLKTTLLDYPEKTASTVFLPYCNMRCPFCHNSDMVDGDFDEVAREEVIEHLKKRRRILDGVCITGGEPTLYGDALTKFIREIKSESGLAVKLDTNGTNPALLESLMCEGLLDYVAMDIKNALTEEDYRAACGRDIDLGKIKASVRLLNSSDVGHEFRTTVVKGIHTREKLLCAAESLRGSSAYYLQHFVNSGKLIAPDGLSDFSKEEMEEIAQDASQFVKTFVRGV